MSEQEATLDEFTESDPSELDDTCRVGDRIEIIKGTKPDEVVEESVDGAERYLVVDTLTGEEQKYAVDDGAPRAKPEDIIMIMDGSKSGRVYPGGHGILGSTMASIRPEEINPTFLYFFLEKNFNRINSATKGSAVPHTDKDLVRSLEYEITSRDEQRKIASVLYTVDQAIQKTEEIIEQSHRVKAGLMQDVFHGQHREHEDYKSTPVGKIPSHWRVASIGDVVHTAQYGLSESLSEEGEYPVFRMNNIENGYMIDEPMKYIDLDDREFKKYRVEQGDILFNRTNSLELVGKTGLYDLEGDHVFASYLVRLQTNDRADSYYLNYYMNSSEGQNRMMDFATKGVSQANINANSIQQVSVPLPPLEEQKDIADRIQSLDEQIEANKQSKSRFKRLKQGLMQDLLSGEVRTHDKDIEIIDDVLKHG